MSEGDTTARFAEWSQKLAELLKEAGAAAQQTDVTARFALSTRLTEFIINSIVVFWPRRDDLISP